MVAGEEREPCRHLPLRASGFVLVEKAVLQGQSVAEGIARGKGLLIIQRASCYPISRGGSCCAPPECCVLSAQWGLCA